MNDPLTHEAFSENLGSEFSVKDGERGQNLKLIKVSERKLSPRQEQFSIIFCGGTEAPLEQGLFLMEHQKMGSFEIFFVPVKRDEQGMHYEAIFNRFRE